MTVKGAIDIVVNLRTPDEIEVGPSITDEDFGTKVRQDEATRKGVPIADYIKMMDRAGIERSLLIAARCGDMRMRGSAEIPYERVAEICRTYPDRFSGLAGVDPTLGVRQLRELEHAVRELGFVGAHYYPHWFDMAPDHPYVFPIYGKCAELDIPIMMQVGQNLIYQRDRRLPSVGRPICLDRVAILYPELKLLGIHLGVPWMDEMIAMAWKHDNIYIGGDAYAPRYWPQSVVHYSKTYGQDKFLFGTDWPVIDPERAVREIGELGYKPGPYQKMMRDNALRVFRLPDQGLASAPPGWRSAFGPDQAAG
jgi:predicted TIM-barrel fold metal-dependent hydrolase